MNGKISIGQVSENVFEREKKFGAHNYGPLPVAICKGQGQYITRYHNYAPLPVAICKGQGQYITCYHNYGPLPVAICKGQGQYITCYHNYGPLPVAIRKARWKMLCVSGFPTDPAERGLP